MGALIVKVPQILNILNAGSAEGLAASMFYMEIFTLIIQCSYNLQKGTPFSVYGENVFILVQTLVIVIQIWYYS